MRSLRLCGERLQHSFLLALLLLALFSINAHAQGEQAARASTDTGTASTASGTLSGRITGDDGRPVSDAVVLAYGAYAPSTARGASTDAAGRFQINDLPPGIYILRATAPGYVVNQSETQNPWEPRYYRPGESVQLTLVKGGVITGTVTGADGEPMVSTFVRAMRVRDAQGRRLPPIYGFGGAWRMTDDRGIYRIYGLEPGTYLVVAGGSYGYMGSVGGNENDTPIFYPSSTRDTATEVPVRSSEESAGIDIRYRSERGHSVSGTVLAQIDPGTRFGINLILTRASTGIFESATFVTDFTKRSFSFSGISDGEYELTAQGSIGGRNNIEMLASEPRRVVVRGSDVTGLQVQLAPLASISGRVTLEAEKDEACPAGTVASVFPETLLIVRREIESKERLQPPSFSTGGSVPNAQGEFLIRNLSAGVFRLTVRPPGEDWYVRSLVLPQVARAAAPAAQAAKGKPALAPGTFSLKTSERVSGIAVTLSQGAASVRGRVGAPAEAGGLPPNLRVYLVPQERERADDPLRYSEASVSNDGSFTLANLAPGRYWLTVRPVPDAADAYLRAPRLLALDEEPRAILRREAEAGKVVLELKPCQRVQDYALPYTAK